MLNDTFSPLFSCSPLPTLTTTTSAAPRWGREGTRAVLPPFQLGCTWIQPWLATVVAVVPFLPIYFQDGREKPWEPEREEGPSYCCLCPWLSPAPQGAQLEQARVPLQPLPLLPSERIVTYFRDLRQNSLLLLPQCGWLKEGCIHIPEPPYSPDLPMKMFLSKHNKLTNSNNLR